MKRLWVILPLLLIFSCEDKEEQKEQLFTYRTMNLPANQKHSVYLHDSSKPSEEPIATAELGANDSIVFELNKSELGEIKSLIMTMVNKDLGTGDLIGVFSYYGMPVGMDYTEFYPFETDGTQSVVLKIVAPNGKKIMDFSNDIGNWWNWGMGHDSVSISRPHNVYTNSNKLTMMSTIRTTDGNKYVGILLDKNWIDGMQYTLTDWTQNSMENISVNIKEPSWSWGDYGSTRIYLYLRANPRLDWLTDYWQSSNSELSGYGNHTISLTSSNLNTWASKNDVSLYVNRNSNGVFNSATAVAQYNGYYETLTLEVKDLPVSFDYSSANKMVANVSQGSNVDYTQLLFLNETNMNQPVYVYFDADEFDSVSIPNINISFANHELYRARTMDFDVYDSLPEVMSWISQLTNDFSQSWGARHYNYYYYDYFNSSSANMNKASYNYSSEKMVIEYLDRNNY